MKGTVTPGLEITLPLQVHADANAFIIVTASVDTGFGGHLTLPSHLIARLGLSYKGARYAQMGDGSVVSMRLYRAWVVWDGLKRQILVHETNIPPLIGTALLKGTNLTVDMVDGGRVLIEPLA